MSERREVRLDAAIETGAKRAFAWAPDWPGWCRSGRDEDAALEALLQYRDRYTAAIASSGLTVPAVTTWRIAESLPGSATTDFGAPGAISVRDRTALRGTALLQQVSCLTACWQTLDDVAATAPPRLRKGPRGGGRDRDAIVEHVDSAESAYGRKIGVRTSDATTDVRRELIVEALRAGGLPQGPRAKPWPLRYAIRRIAWHVLDHAWEIEDKSE